MATTEKKTKKIKQLPGKIATGVSAFILAAAGGYFLTPTRTRVVDLGKPKSEDEEYSENFDHFLEHLSSYLDTGIDGLHAEFEDFNIHFQEEGKAENNINVEGSLDFKMRNIDDIELKLDTEINYNGVELPLTFGYADSTVFMAFKDFKVKSTSQQTENLKALFDYYFQSASGLNLDLNGMSNRLIDKLFSSASTGDLTSSLGSIAGSGMNFKLGDKEVDNGYIFTVQVSSSSMDVDIEIKTDKEYTMENVNFKKLNFGIAQISGQIHMDIHPLTIALPNLESEEWVEIISYSGWMEKLANLLSEDKQKLGMDFSVDVSLKGKEMGSVKGDVNFDFSQLLDLSAYKNEEVQPNAKRAAIDFDAISELTKKVQLGVNVNMYGQKGTAEEAPLYATLGIDFVDNDGYIRLNENEGVMRAVVEEETINWLINEMPKTISDTINSLGLEKADVTATLGDTFDFITDSSVVSGIKNGDYSKVLEVLKTFKTVGQVYDDTYENGQGEIVTEKYYEGQVVVELDLSVLGLGDNALLSVTLDASRIPGRKVLDLSLTDVEIGDLGINVNLGSADFKEINPGDKSTYDNMNFLPGVINQVAGMVQQKVGSFGLEGTVLDDSGLGLKIKGDAVFNDSDDNKFGYGQLQIDQYKYHANQVWYTHYITIDARNKDPRVNSVNNDIKFVYGKVNPGQGEHNIKGHMTVQTVLDIKDLIMEFMGDATTDERFTKFLAPLKEMMTMGEVSAIVDSGDYLSFAKSTFIKKIGQSNGGNRLDIQINGEILGLDSDLVLAINLKTKEDGSKAMETIEIVDLKVSGKTINFSAYIDETFSGEDNTPLNLNDTYMDFSDIKVLLRFGINTTELGVYNLEGTIDMTALKIFNVSIKVTAKVVVDGKNVKVIVGADIPKILSLASALIQEDYGWFSGIDGVHSELTFETYADDDPNKKPGNDIGGYFNIRRDAINKKTEVIGYHSGIFGIQLPTYGTAQYDNYYCYRATSDHFMDDIIFYLLRGFLGLKQNIVDSVGSLALSNDAEEKPAGDYTNLFTSTGFQYNESTKTWNVGINIGAVTGVEALQSIEATIVGTEVGGKGYFTNLKGTLNIQASLATITVGFDLSLIDIDPVAEDWDEATQNTFVSIAHYNIANSYLNSRTAYEYQIRTVLG